MQPAPYRQLPGDTLPPARAFWLRAADGVRLRASLWGEDDARRTVLLFPGRSEYAEKYAPAAVRFTAAGFAVLAIDWRGQGASARLLQDPRLGHVGQFAEYQTDVDALTQAAELLGLPRPWHLLAHSMGGCIGLRSLLRGLPVASAAFSSPMWGIRVSSLPPRIGDRLANGLATAARRAGRSGRSTSGPSSVLDIAFSGNLLTGNVMEYTRFMREAVAWPELQLGAATWGWLGAAMAECRALAALPSPSLPSLITVSGREALVLPGAIRRRAAAWSGATLLELPQACHEALFEGPDIRDRVIDDILSHMG